ncbi:MAG: GvpL/GvpF family gas vesicle protein [Pseudomonadota bacterium]
MDHALYLFCLTRTGPPTVLEPAGTVGERAFVFSVYSDISAVVSEVPLAEFSGPLAEENLCNLQWVGPRALCHQEIILCAMKSSPVLPARFGTLFSSRESLAALVETNFEEINDFLDSVTGKDEWAVKGLLSKSHAKKKLLGERGDCASEALSELSPGLRYFKEKQLQAEVEKDLVRWLKEAMSAVADDLTICSSDRRKRKIVSLSAEDGDRATVVNWAFLVDRGCLDDFMTRLGRANNDYADFGLSMELSGPWPPYSFAPALHMESEK